MSRDPRVTPKVDDMLRTTCGTTFLVVHVTHYVVTYVELGSNRTLECHISEWREMAKTDTVLRAEEGP